MNVTARIEGDKLIIELPVNTKEPQPSASGKTLVVASSPSVSDPQKSEPPHRLLA